MRACGRGGKLCIGGAVPRRIVGGATAEADGRLAAGHRTASAVSPESLRLAEIPFVAGFAALGVRFIPIRAQDETNQAIWRLGGAASPFAAAARKGRAFVSSLAFWPGQKAGEAGRGRAATGECAPYRVSLKLRANWN
jgi:hypothetical protein